MIQLLRFRDIEYFRAVAEHKSFSRAADACNIGQPTLSAQIKRMEELLGLALFERHQRTVTLTAEGADVLAATDSIWEGYLRIRRTAAGDGLFLGRELSFGVLPTIAPYFAPAFLAQLLDLNKGADISFIEDRTSVLEAAVASDAIDFAVTATTPARRDITAVPLGLERLAAVSAEALPNPVAIDALHGPVLLMQEGHCFRDVVRDALRRAGNAAPSPAHIGPASFATLLSLVRGGHGDAVVPAPLVSAQVSAFEGLHTAQVSPENEGRELRILVRAGRETYNDVSQIVDAAQRVLRALPAAAD